jgi:hypothetical protein
MTTTLTPALEWAAVEFGGAELGDERRSRRLVRVAAALAEDPHGTLPGSFEDWAEIKAAYRLLEEPDVTYERVQAGHRRRVRAGCGGGGEHLLVEDTTELDFTHRRAMRDLGRIGNDGGQGLFVHSTLALSLEHWEAHQQPAVLVEGLFEQRCWARTEPTGRKRRPKHQKLSGPRESQRWAAVAEQVGPPPPGARWTLVADRESDVFEAFQRCRDNGWGFIIRACQPRALVGQDGPVQAAVAAGPEMGRFYVDLRARGNQPARRAQVTVKACAVTLRGPWRPGGDLAPCAVHVVEAAEVEAPTGVEPIRWVLLTDWPCAKLRPAMKVVKAYACRWLIEEYHKCLKSGTGIEHSQLSTAGGVQALLGVLAVVAVRLLNTKLLAATRPEEPVDPAEFGPEALAILEHKYGRPAGGWTNQSFWRALARLGGFPARRGDGQPGWQTIWRGWHKLILLVQGYDLANRQRCG